ncbi:hypothetical protein [Sulfurirhabdus autotrophica]|uniref:Uncharacterized protein n=1 Tax=Sulfurirhabdus autotrophica TaxID=1706046 RepID=A0A4R3XTE5_9PROT|nr:hypothetical protein [Sulfurirhabdus autotrophica]TCV81263.1 hypothetical protein EDC63_12411 [Sulfurirhabdus autotrophica]
MQPHNIESLTEEAKIQGYREVTEDERKSLPDLFRRAGVPESDVVASCSKTNGGNLGVSGSFVTKAVACEFAQ